MTTLGPYDLNTIITGDARELAKAIPDESVDLIFTDPVYDRIDDYRWLAETAARVLKPDSACLVWIHSRLIAESIVAMSALNFRWPLILFKATFTGGKLVGKNILSKSNICLWMQKGKITPNKILWDVSIGYVLNKYTKSNHRWTKDPSTIERWIDSFTNPNATILDPFTGGGTVPAVCKMLHRNYLAFEIDPATADMARKRVAETQPPLPIVYHEQMELLT